ncbi:diphthine--ammonia ligase isoform X2 [Beta vulgaris subsp. vulgaris]|uniref:diphthine--ammonia ligase isoform X2 n=1 Tax=Beta vulgaris subsp. vulgaris TaxID=3555 RepID=UPI00053FEF52|nr:diphthine--ammonia ligase isoform X2 [Beta vulgaris subsp. vulgaris]
MRLWPWLICCLWMIQSTNWTAICIKLSGIRLLLAMQNAWDCPYSGGDYKVPPGKIFKQDCFDRHHELSYKMTPGDEVEDMFCLLSEVKRQIPAIAAVSSGAIASDYQRLRVESVCSRLGLVSLAYMWKREQSLLLQEMITSGIVAIIVKVAAIGLHPAKHLGKELAHMTSHLHHLNGLYGINVCGEGGEYETLTLDCPLFKFARIVLDDFQVVLHSPDSIAPVGVLHPSAFHVEPKGLSTYTSDSNCNNGTSLEEMNCVYDVQGDCTLVYADQSQVSDSLSDTIESTTYHLQMTKIDRGDTFSICCWLQDLHRSSSGLQNDLKVILSHLQSQLKQYGFSWEDVLYIHLYIADMNEFAAANETYVSFITHEKCRFGVPSRSTVELPLLQAGLGKAYVEVLVSRDKTKKVLHVQSISRWAPSCIGPYSQATLNHGILHMAGQLGLNPPTMTLCDGGITSELEQALLNSEAIANCFRCSISTSTISFIVYCSAQTVSLNRTEVQDKWEGLLEQLKLLYSAKGSVSEVFAPILLFILAPQLPKRALIEVKPTLFIREDDTDESEDDFDIQDHQTRTTQQDYWGFQDEPWHHSCLQKCIVPGNICAVMLNITCENITKICNDTLVSGHPLSEGHTEKLAKWCIYLIDSVLSENLFSWENAMYFRVYFRTDSFVQMERLSLILSRAFQEFAEINPKFKSGHEPIFNLVPVLGSGTSMTSMDAVFTCELLAQKPSC